MRDNKKALLVPFKGRRRAAKLKRRERHHSKNVYETSACTGVLSDAATMACGVYAAVA